MSAIITTIYNQLKELEDVDVNSIFQTEATTILIYNIVTSKIEGLPLGNLGAGGGPISFVNIINKPTTLSGYGITNAYTKTEVDTLIQSLRDELSNPSNSYSLTDSDGQEITDSDGQTITFEI